VIGEDATRLLPELDLDAAINHFYRQRSPLELSSGENKTRIYPVFDARRELAYAVIAFDEKGKVKMPKVPEPVKKEMKETSRRWFEKLRERWNRRNSRE
jgi:hypothetical protein